MPHGVNIINKHTYKICCEIFTRKMSFLSWPYLY